MRNVVEKVRPARMVRPGWEVQPADRDDWLRINSVVGEVGAATGAWVSLHYVGGTIRMRPDDKIRSRRLATS